MWSSQDPYADLIVWPLISWKNLCIKGTLYNKITRKKKKKRNHIPRSISVKQFSVIISTFIIFNNVQTMLNILSKKRAIFNQSNNTHFDTDPSRFFLISREPQLLLSVLTRMEQLTHISAAEFLCDCDYFKSVRGLKPHS